MPHVQNVLSVTLGMLFLIPALQCNAAEPLDGNPRTAYFTVGDAQDLLEFPPLDSRISIATAFETLKQQWQLERIWWRGGQDEIWGKEFVIRSENRQFAKIWDWWKDLQYRTVGTNRIAVEEAHRRGMSIWLAYGLFDNGSQADAGYSGFPYAIEDKLRIDHPEWAPVNRWGTWRQGGPIEFAYPEARQAMADYLARYVVDGNYDGISFLTYAENFSQRYEDEFGYNDPIVKDFQKTYGKDIRREEFDRDAWRRLRGGYVTEFLRLLKNKLAPHGKRIAVCVRGQNPDRPVLWNVNGGICTAGNVTWSIEEWLKGDVVDEICLVAAINNESLQKLIKQALSANSPVQITAWRSRGDLPANVPRVMFLGREIESGYQSEAWVDYPDEQLTAEPVQNLALPDVYARRRVLTLALKGKQSLSAPQLSQAVVDDDLYVRRTALRSIAKHNVRETKEAVRGALKDPENTVRCLAALALAELGDIEGLPLLLSTAFHPESLFQFQYRAVPDALKKMATVESVAIPMKPMLVARLRDEDPHTRELALYYFTLVGAPATSEVEQLLTDIALHDRSEYSRELAVVNLRSSFGPTANVTNTLRHLIQHDESHAVQVRAATAYSTMSARLPADDAGRSSALQELIACFRQYGDGCQRTDREWGWRLLGNSLLEFGPSGEQALQALMADANNRDLSDRAWKILHLQQGDQFFPITEEQDVAAHRLHPWLR